MLVVADHRFFKYMGRGEESTTINYLVSKCTLLKFAGIDAGKHSDGVVKTVVKAYTAFVLIAFTWERAKSCFKNILQ